MNGAADAQRNGASPRDPRVLYIEDDTPNLRLVEYILRQIQHLQFAAAATGEHGLRLATQLEPSLILLDLHLPDIGGLRVLERLRALPSTCAIPVVVLSGDLSMAERERLGDFGAVEFLAKPYAIGELVALVKRFVAARG